MANGGGWEEAVYLSVRHSSGLNHVNLPLKLMAAVAVFLSQSKLRYGAS